MGGRRAARAPQVLRWLLGLTLALPAACLCLTALAMEDIELGGPARPPLSIQPPLARMFTLQGFHPLGVIDRFGVARPSQPFKLERLIFPSAVAARGQDLYIFDQATGWLYRYDLGMRLLVRIRQVEAGPGARIRTSAALTLLLLAPGDRSILRLSYAGQILRRLGDGEFTARPTDFLVDESRGRVFVADAALQRIVGVHPDGHAAYILFPTLYEDRTALTSIAALAGDRDALYIADRGCRCVLRYDLDTSVVWRIGEGEIALPGPMVVDRHGRLLVADRANGRLLFFRDGRLEQHVTAPSLGLLGFDDLAIDGDTLYVADMIGAKVGAFRLLRGADEGN